MDYSNKHIYIMSGTHWDREWYRPFQGFRYKLVKIITQVIETLEQHPEFPVFTMDGQTVVLEDYLAIRPEMRERLTKLIQDGRILIGPWYCMPDEQIISGESIVKNLLRGQEVCHEFGVEPWKYGYICDIFGHASQTPQIFNGFGIDKALMGRGLNDGKNPPHFVWRSPNGSECLTFKVPDWMLYGDFTCRVILMLDGCSTEEEKDEMIRKAVEEEFRRTNSDTLLLMDALDHMPIHLELLDCCERIRRMFPGIRIEIGNAIDMAKEVEAQRESLPVETGSLLHTTITDNPAQRLISFCGSSRYDVKQDNDRCETLIDKWLAPFMLYTRLHGGVMYEGFLKKANEYLLKNHPHDSICGCSIDEVHQDMHYRCRQIKALTCEALTDMKHQMDSKVETDPDSQEIIIRVYNPLPFARKEAVTVEIPFPAEYPHKFSDNPHLFEMVNAFRIRDRQGNDLPYNLSEIRTNTQTHWYEEKYRRGDLYTVSFMAELPAMGCESYEVYFPKKESVATRYRSGLATGFQTAENEYLKLKINDNGTFCLTDKETGRVNDGLLYYVDDGEIGDGWNHVKPVDDRLCVSKGSPCRVEILDDGPVCCTFGVTTQFQIPKKMEYQKGVARGYHRSEETEVLEITSRISLKSGSRYVEVETEVNNLSCDHRLRMVFPTDFQSDSYLVSQPFGMAEFAVGRDTSTDDYNEPDEYENINRGVVAKRDGTGEGLAVISAGGLHEASAFPDGSLAVTMFRGFFKTVYTNGQPDGQLPGKLTFHFAVMPLRKEDSFGALQRVQDVLAAGIEASFVQNAKPELPAAESLLSITGDDSICYSTFAPSADGKAMVLRLYNPEPRKAQGKVTVCFPLERVVKARLDEVPVEEMEHSANEFSLCLGESEIATYLLYQKKN